MKSFSSNRKTTRVNRSRRSISLVVVTTLLCTLLAGVLSKIASVKASASASFAPATSFAMGASPTGVVVGDFNKDGKPDVVTANSGSNNISLRAGDGSGGFGSAANFNVATSPSSVAVGDFNKDGNLDLVTANAGSNNVSVLLGNGSGSFAAAVNFNVASNPSSVAVGDFNNDGNPDIVTANSNDNNVSILLGNGNGGFSAAVNFAVGMQPSSVVIGDFNGDSKLDIATANLGSNDISILLGNGSGGFSAANNFNSGGTGPRSIAIGDFNRDGLYDLVVTNRSSNNVSILLGNGVGSFGAASNFNVGSNPTSVVVADFNQDGIPDLAVANNSSNTTSILLGNGTGGFGASSDFNVGTGPIAAAVGDFNADGKPDLVIANANSNDASMLLNTNTATPISQPEFVSGNKLTTGPALNLTEAPDQIVTADFNNDGIPDLAVLNNLGAVAIFLGKGDGTFGTRITLPSGGVSFSFAIGDFNRDGKLDIVTGNQNNTVSVFLGNGTGSFGFPSNITTNGGANYVAVGDFNGDGNLDIAAGHEQNTLTSTTISIMLGTGTGTFGPSTDFNAGKSVFAIAVGDFNQDGKIDLATADLQRGSVEILLGNGNGRFGFPNSFSASDGPISIAVADFNGDGKQDLVVGDAVDQKISILIGSGTGTFGLPTFSSTNNASSVIASGDFNGDGKLDVAVPNRSDGTVSVILGTGTGTFGSPITFLSGGGPAAVGVGDFNRDGLLDLVVANSIDDNVSVLLGANPGPDSNLGIIQINGGANPQVGLPFSLIVQSQDSNGVPSNVVNDTTVTLSVNTGTGSLSGNLTGIIKSGTNYATISGVIYGKSGNGVSLTVSRTSGDNLSAGHSPQFTVNQATGISADPAGVCLGNTPCLTDIQAAIESTLPGGSVLVYPGQYNSSVIVDQPLTVEFTGNVVLNDLSIESSGATVMDSGTISLRGNFNHDLGNFFTLMGTVSFIGSDTTSKQRINGSQQTSFANLVINNTGAGVMIQGSDKVVNLVLTLDTNLDTNGFKLIMPETAASVGSADVIGDVVRTNIGDAPLGTKLSFGNPFNTISIDSGSQPSQITVRLTEITPNDASTGQTNSGFSNAVERTYVITPNGGSGFSATVQLHYLTADLNGNDPNTLHLWRFNSSSGQWEDKGADTQDTVNQSVTKSGITAFSPWTLSSAVTPTAVNFESFTATSEAGAVSLRWNTGFEVNNFGFNIYREVNGQRVKVNPSLIAGSALMVGSNVKVKAGSGYYWQDETN
ncbi:MAG TPA: VCBS repeat-containing protein, partial [Blastocatellia bacterium]|nr:VCBS repeat-containing protein [Blastocatellia bacterium]